MLISAEIAESDPNFRNCSQYRKSQLFRNCLYADPSLMMASRKIRSMDSLKDIIKFLIANHMGLCPLDQQRGLFLLLFLRLYGFTGKFACSTV